MIKMDTKNLKVENGGKPENTLLEALTYFLNEADRMIDDLAQHKIRSLQHDYLKRYGSQCTRENLEKLEQPENTDYHFDKDTILKLAERYRKSVDVLARLPELIRLAENQAASNKKLKDDIRERVTKYNDLVHTYNALLQSYQDMARQNEALKKEVIARREEAERYQKEKESFIKKTEKCLEKKVQELYDERNMRKAGDKILVDLLPLLDCLTQPNKILNEELRATIARQASNVRDYLGPLAQGRPMPQELETPQIHEQLETFAKSQAPVIPVVENLDDNAYVVLVPVAEEPIIFPEAATNIDPAETILGELKFEDIHAHAAELRKQAQPGKTPAQSEQTQA